MKKLRRALSVLSAIVLLATMIPLTTGEVKADGKQDVITYSSPVFDTDGTTLIGFEEKSIGGDTGISYTVINENNAPTSWGAGWYVVQGNVTINGTVTATAAVNLILTDGCCLTVNANANGNAGIEVGTDDNAFTVYGQSEGTGTLVARGHRKAATSSSTYLEEAIEGGAGIGGKTGTGANNIVINGGNIKAYGAGTGSGIGSGYYKATTYMTFTGYITINGGTVYAEGGTGYQRDKNYTYYYQGGSGIGAYNYSTDITINGGSVTAVGKNGHPGIGGGSRSSNLVINGGIVNASGDSKGCGIGSGVSAVTINGGEISASGTSAFGVGDGYSSLKVTASEIYTGSSSSNQYVSGTTDYTSVVSGKNYVRIRGAHKTSYLDLNGARQIVSAQYVMNNTASMNAADSGWYVLPDNYTFSKGLTVTGNVNLIVPDACTSKINAEEGHAGISVSGDGNSLTIWGQKDSRNPEMDSPSPQLIITAGAGGAGIGGNSGQTGENITINGGVINVYGVGGACIGGGEGAAGKNITVNGGIISASLKVHTEDTTAKFGAALGGGYQGIAEKIYINGGWLLLGVRNDEKAELSAAIGSGADCSTPAKDIYCNISRGLIGAATQTGEIILNLNASEDVSDILADYSILLIYDNISYYVDESDAEEVTEADLIEQSTTALTDGWWYCANGTNSLSGLTVSGDVKLILADEAQLTISGGLTIEEGGSLTVYGQDHSSGRMNISGGIAGTGKLIICGGITEIAGASGAAAVNGDAELKRGVLKVSAEALQKAVNGTFTVSDGGLVKVGTASDDAAYASAYNGEAYLMAQTKIGIIYLDYDSANKQFRRRSGYAYQYIEGSVLGGFDDDNWYFFQGTKTVSGGLKVSGNVNLILEDGCNITVNGSQNQAGIEVSGDTDSLIIHGQSDGKKTGKLSATGGDQSAGIGGGLNQAGQNITINGGIIISGGKNNASGIGGGKYTTYSGPRLRSKNITINGGTVYATGAGAAAGIGGGFYGTAENIVINGGNVTAVSTSTGAGIGGGYRGDAVGIVINGGIIQADGGSGAAGIGSGYTSEAETLTGDVTITGGVITATSASGNAIGGWSSDKSNSGSTVKIDPRLQIQTAETGYTVLKSGRTSAENIAADLGGSGTIYIDGLAHYVDSSQTPSAKTMELSAMKLLGSASDIVEGTEWYMVDGTVAFDSLPSTGSYTFVVPSCALVSLGSIDGTSASIDFMTNVGDTGSNAGFVITIGQVRYYISKNSSGAASAEVTVAEGVSETAAKAIQKVFPAYDLYYRAVSDGYSYVKGTESGKTESVGNNTLYISKMILIKTITLKDGVAYAGETAIEEGSLAGLSYDSESGNWVMDGISVNGSGQSDPCFVFEDTDAKLLLRNENRILSEKSGISVSGTLTIGGTGSLHVKAGEKAFSGGTVAWEENLLVWSRPDESRSAVWSDETNTFVYTDSEGGQEKQTAAGEIIIDQRYYTVTTTSVVVNAGGETVARTVACVSGGGDIKGQKIAMLTAETLSGYEFLGWFAGEEKLSGEIAYGMKVDKNTDCVARYQLLTDQKFKLSVTGKDYSVQIGEEITDYTEASETEYSGGTLVTVTYTGPEEFFLYWGDDQGNLVCAQKSYTFQLNSARKLEAVRTYVSGGNAKLTYCDEAGKTVYTSYFKTTDETVKTPASAPEKAGYVFDKWVFTNYKGNEVEISVDALIREMENGRNQITITPKYKTSE